MKWCDDLNDLTICVFFFFFLMALKKPCFSFSLVGSGGFMTIASAVVLHSQSNVYFRHKVANSKEVFSTWTVLHLKSNVHNLKLQWRKPVKKKQSLTSQKRSGVSSGWPWQQGLQVQQVRLALGPARHHHGKKPSYLVWEKELKRNNRERKAFCISLDLSVCWLILVWFAY